MASLLRPHEPVSSPSPAVPGFALWQLGFRPFYLVASLFAALSVPLWVAQFAGVLPRPLLAGSLWHAHEMVFGFTLAVVVGFLFTAGRNWSGQPTPTGRSLQALVLLWLLARVLVLTPFAWAAAISNAAFPLAAAVGLARALGAGRNRRNYFFVALLAMLSPAALVVHLEAMGLDWAPGRVGVQVAMDVVLFMLAVMGGRVIPMFTNNALPGTGAQRRPWLERLALGGVLALLAADLLPWHGVPLAVLAGLAALAHAARLALWRLWKTLRTPLLWVLHAGYAWIPVHLLLRAAAELGWLASSPATHALTAGAIGGLIIGMITRTARGHTGRPLAADRWDVACYTLVLGAAAVRVVLPLVVPAAYLPALMGSALLWAAGFGLYAVRYWPVLSRARADGKPG
ncbi:NnrS family protein [Eleftheria terrae]|uniref:NnrS family protein n=1 Tax=Eleftheria terrae TaxID=1597781 RepID=UPI00263B756F|nr:NnrS family protein [Eleftheria terrae]WKB55396.1 NnrS family protein [Eleftheria terrae]